MNEVNGLNIFGSLTIRNGQIDKSSLDKKYITESGDIDYIAILENADNIDSVDLSTADKDADMKVTDDDMNLWEQESKMQMALDTLKPQVVKDFTGEAPEDIIAVLEKLNEFRTSFENEYLKENEVSTMAAAFEELLPEKYAEIKKEAQGNTKNAIKERVIENLIEEYTKDAENGGRSLLGIVAPDALTIPESTKKIIINELEKESEKYIKNYKDNNLEEDLTKHLHKFMAETDKEKLAGAIQKWEDDKTKIDNNDDNNAQDDKNALRQLKESVKSFLTTAVLLGVPIKIGGITVRTESAIPQALSNFDNINTLKTVLDDAISQLSTTSRKEKLQGKKDSNLFSTQNNTFSFSAETQSRNFFKL